MLFSGILGVIPLRAAMIGPGAALVAEFARVLWILGAFLVATGVKAQRRAYDGTPPHQL